MCGIAFSQIVIAFDTHVSLKNIIWYSTGPLVWFSVQYHKKDWDTGVSVVHFGFSACMCVKVEVDRVAEHDKGVQLALIRPLNPAAPSLVLVFHWFLLDGVLS